MAAHVRHHEAAGRLDLEAGTTRIVERLFHQARRKTLALVRPRHLGVGEDAAIALLVIDRDGKSVLGLHLVAAERFVVRHRHPALPLPYGARPREIATRAG